MSNPYILVNDEFVLSNHPVLTANNRAFRYGDGVFESMRMVNGKLQFAELHADRLKAGMKTLKIDGYNLLDEYFLKQKTAELQKKNRLQGNVRYRLTVYRGGAGLYTPDSNKAGYVLEAESLDNNHYELNKKGLIIDVYDELTKHIDKLSNCKTINSLLFVLAGIYKKKHRLDEALILNHNGFLCESISSNLFVVYKDQIYTPSLEEGCIAGVMRTVVMQLAKQNDIQIVEAQINPQILTEADEVFVTNAVSGIRWVMGYGRKRYFNEKAKFLSTKLNETLS
ncbi:aminotransferase class IV [Pedobacter montanisoli]|uniref:branched-chain-amino-acid transaminase n=1 Tax=Pedobacter montanisoli TaxID=2923277 RepID=A0ABS9ZYD0_9SPHI|nr:aminotransferase class IV [Pedobacter montanisoli]MCJ0743327.1 aminotransferase class IV [Pedobacter montanisoli]